MATYEGVGWLLAIVIVTNIDYISKIFHQFNKWAQIFVSVKVEHAVTTLLVAHPVGT